APNNYHRYYEPFLGGGALFFFLQPEKPFLSDINSSLINTYKTVKEKPSELISDLKKHIYQKEYYYLIRDVDRSGDLKYWTDVEKASRFIYLNKTCFNGLHRVNSKGQFNTPFGKYKNPTILDEENLILCNKALQNASIKHQSFLEIEDSAMEGDFVYFDPPYAPISSTSNFTSFAKENFGEDMQIELSNLCARLDKKGVLWMLSNSAVPLISDLYKNFKIERISALRAINSKANSRGKIDEFIITNY
ncbi:MAG: DNA adenine methylase, partial [Bdellovibrionales bacterium]|nr:DNA adenine methylase [Bdellovibrionales bacterium]